MKRIFVLLFACAVVYGNPIDSNMAQYDTIVVGLGSAGTTAASTLARAGKRVLALEAQDRIGGRVHTIPFGDGVVELGAEWIHGTHTAKAVSRVYDIALKNNISILPQDMDLSLFRSDGSRGDADILNELAEFVLHAVDHPPAEPQPLGEFLTKKIKEHLREKHPNVANDEDYVEQLLHYFDLFIDSYEASNSWNDVTTMTRFEDLEGHQALSWHTYGYKTFFELLLNTYNNGPGLPNLDIKLNTEVVHINWPKEGGRPVVVTCKDGKQYTADNVIVTLSVGVLKERHSTLFSPALPKEKVTAIEKTSFGVVGKVIFAFPEVTWPNEMFNFVWFGVDRKNLSDEDKWMAETLGCSNPMGATNGLSLWFNGEAAKLVETLPDEVVKTKSLAVMRRFMGGNITIPEPTAMVRSKWFSNPFTRGTYSFDNLLVPQNPNARADLGSPLLDEAGKPRVLFAGEATDLTHFSTVHGASDTGYREALRLLQTPSKI